VKGNFGLIIFGVIAIVVSIVLFGVAVEQLDTAMTAANSTNLTNEMPGLYDVMGVYGILFWVAITGSGLAMLGFGVWGTVKSARGRR